MSIALLGSLSGMLLGWLLGFLSLFLILLILIQRGKGGGLSGALGGPGGQSAFGSKAGDTFTIITVVVASVWGFTCAFTMWLLGTHAPPPIADSSMTAGPGDDATSDSGLVVPPMDGGESSSISDGIGLSGMESAESDEPVDEDVAEEAVEAEVEEMLDEEAETPAAETTAAETTAAETESPEAEANP